ncbi:MAG: hypothetical protein K2X03_28660 [Bryobacteraceae bacterium]|nr:hypothetical protein [Bryobacteraceae bacterium]
MAPPANANARLAQRPIILGAIPAARAAEGWKIDPAGQSMLRVTQGGTVWMISITGVENAQGAEAAVVQITGGGTAQGPMFVGGDKPGANAKAGNNFGQCLVANLAQKLPPALKAQAGAIAAEWGKCSGKFSKRLSCWLGKAVQIAGAAAFQVLLQSAVSCVI